MSCKTAEKAEPPIDMLRPFGSSRAAIGADLAMETLHIFCTFLGYTCRSGRAPFVVRVRGGKCPPITRRSIMAQYLLSVHSVEGEARDPMTEEEMRQFQERIGALQEEMKSAGAWVFVGRLHEPDTATVVRVSEGETLTTDG